MDDIKVNGVNRQQGPVFEPSKVETEENVFNVKNNNPIDSSTVERETEMRKESKVCVQLIHILANEALRTDENLLAILEEIKELDIALFMDTFSFNCDGIGLMEYIDECENIKESTKDKFYNYFEKALSDAYGFDKHFKNKGDKTTFEFGDYRFESDTYDIIQKDEDILEVTNKTTGEKRVIDFNTLISPEANTMQNYIALKGVFQKLPGEILFQVPEEVSYIINIKGPQAEEFSQAQMEDVPEASEKVDEVSEEVDEIDEGEDADEIDEDVEEEDESYYTFSDKAGLVNFLGDGYERMFLSLEPDAIIHEISHAVFNNIDKEDALYNNPSVVEAFNQALENLEKDGGQQFVYNDETPDNPEDYVPPKNYWSRNISEFGAEIVTAVFCKDYEDLENIKKYVPEDGIRAVMEVFKERMNATDRHRKVTEEELLDYIRAQEAE